MDPIKLALEAQQRRAPQPIDNAPRPLELSDEAEKPALTPLELNPSWGNTDVRVFPKQKKYRKRKRPG